jgi:predicted cupin superfamily sugar epimerase
MMVRPPLAEQLDLQPHPQGGWFRDVADLRLR